MTKKVELVIVRGLPGSGKSTWSKEWVAESVTRVRINRDDMRFQYYNKYWGLDPHQEDTITLMEDTQVKGLLDAGISVVVDATHLKAEYITRWYDIADQIREVEVDVQIKEFDTPLEVCLERNEKRERTVPEHIIRNNYKKYFRKGKMNPAPIRKTKESSGRIYVPDEEKPKAYMFDIDGTLANMIPSGRNPFDETRVSEDILHSHIAEVLQSLHKSGYKILIMSGRTEFCKKDTEEWLRKHDLHWDSLLMRKKGDRRKDADIKEELFFDHIADNYNVLAVFDDRNHVVERWREIGLPCAQVALGNF